MTEPTGRLIPSLPRWTTHEKSGRKSTRVKPRVQAGMRFVGSAKGWCYRCKSEHLWVDPCGTTPEPGPVPLSITGPVPCTACGTMFVPSAFTRGANRYCSHRCRLDVKSAKSRKGYDGRYG